MHYGSLPVVYAGFFICRVLLNERINASHDGPGDVLREGDGGVATGEQGQFPPGSGKRKIRKFCVTCKPYGCNLHCRIEHLRSQREEGQG